MNEPEEKQAEVTFKYYARDNEFDIKLHMKARDMYRCISDIDDKCRNILKYGENIPGEMQKFCEELREMTWEFRD